MQKIISKFGLKVNLTTAVAGIVVLSGLIFILPRALNVSHADVCQGAPDNVDFNHFPITYTGEPCKDFPTVTIRNVNGQYPQSGSELSQGITASAGDTMYVRLWVHNGAVTGGETANNVNINVSVPTSGTDHIISATISADNDHGRGASGAETIHTNPGETLEVVPGSVEVFDDQGNPLGQPSGFSFNGTSFHFDHQDACFEFAKFIRFQVRVVAAPVQNSQVICAPSNQTVPVGQTVSFTATGSRVNGFDWLVTGGNPSHGSSQSDPGNFSTSFASPGNYQVAVTDGFTNSLCNVTVSQPVAPAPVICSPANQTIQIGQTVTFTASGGKVNGFDWLASEGNPSHGSLQSSPATFSTSFSTSGNHQVAITDGSTTALCNVTVSAAPSVPVACAPLNQTALVGQIVSFTASGGNTNGFDWLVTGGNPSSGSLQGSPKTFSTSFSSPGVYHAAVTDGSTTSLCNVTVQLPATPTLICSPLNQSVLVGQAATFTATGGAGGYNWLASNGTPSTGNANTFTTSFASAGNYQVALTDGKTSTLCNVTVTAQVVPNVICSPLNQSANANQTVFFSATGGDNTNFVWSAPGAAQSSGSGVNFNTSFATSGNKVVTVTSAGKTANCNVNIVVPQPPQLICSPTNQTVDPNQPVFLTATGGNGVYSWQTSGGNPATGSGITFSTAFNTSGSKQVTVTSNGQNATCNVTVNNTQPQPKSYTLSAANFCVGQQPRYTITGTANLIGENINWSSTGPGAANGASVVAVLGSDGSGLAFWSDLGSVWTSSQIGTWAKTATIAGITKTITFNVIDCNPVVPPVQVICSPLNQTAQVGQIVYFTATGGNNSYTWSAPLANQTSGNGQSFSTSFAASGSKLVTVTSGNQTSNCNVQVQAQQNNPVICAPGNQTVNVNQPATFVASGGNGAYTWSASNSNNTSGSGNTFTTSYQNSGSYTVTVNSNGQSSACNVQINTVVQPQVFCSPPNQTANIGQTVWFNASGGNGSYSWSIPGANQSQASGSSMNTTFSGSGTFVATVTSGSQTATCQVQIISTAPSQVICSPAFQSVNVGQTVWFTAIGGNNTYSWSAPGANQSFGNGQSFSPTYATAGNYSATVNSGGQTAACSVYVQGQVLSGNVALTFSKRAINETKNSDATLVDASKEDYITYTLVVSNSGNSAATNFVISDDLSGVLPYADMVDNGGGTLNGNVISYPAISVPANGSVSKSFRVRVKFFLADNLSYTMTNTYGNTVVIHINTPQIITDFVAPKTGADTGAFMFAGVLTAAFALYRKKRFLKDLILN